MMVRYLLLVTLSGLTLLVAGLPAPEPQRGGGDSHM